MKLLKHKITFKVLMGYIILGFLAIISGALLFSEIKTFIYIQEEGIADKKRILKTSSLIASIYENENLGRAAIQLNSAKKINEYTTENKLLLLKIDSLNFIIENAMQKSILDSIKLGINKKYKNITSLYRISRRNNSDKSINEAINKLRSIDTLLGKITTKEFVENSKFFDKSTKQSLEEYFKYINSFDDDNKDKNINQKEIDSLVSISKIILQKAQKQSNNKKRFLRVKEKELVENDLIISRKLIEVLNSLEKSIISYSSNIHNQHQKMLSRSKNIILLAGGVSFIIIVFFSFIILNDFWKSQHYRIELENANIKTSSLLKSREQLISMVSHDLRTPLSTVIGYSELLQKSINNTKEKNQVTHIQTASVYMRKLVEDLLEFSKLENGEIGIECIPFNIEKLLNEVFENAKNLIKEKLVKIILKSDKAFNKNILSDPFRIKQILYNLVTNSCKFTNNGVIKIEAKLQTISHKKYLEVTVSDTGLGIDESEQEKIFKPFSQLQLNEKGKKGFGLGLTISKKLTELLGGTLTLKSNLGEGSVFILKIPIRFSENTLPKEKKQSIKFKNKLKAIVVEDDVTIRELLKNIFEQLGIQVVLFTNGQNALESINELVYDFVLTDIQLPKMNGIQFMETLKKMSSYKQQPIIAMTGRASFSKKEYIEIGFSDILLKPFSMVKLECLIQSFFSEKDLEPPSKLKLKTFSFLSLKEFLNNDETEVKNMLALFLKETKKNSANLEKAISEEDIISFNNISHKMLSMFKQIEATDIVEFLEAFETTTRINDSIYENFKANLECFVLELENYLN